ncbi:MAG: GNAT family N-acetyltransferase [Rhodothermia bacterium]
MSAPFTIRNARENDFPQIVAILQEVGLLTDGLTPGMPDLYVADIGGAVVGCAALESDGSTGLLRSVGVLPAAQGSGIGGRLVEAVHERAMDLGLESIYLLTATADKYFPRFGYEPSVEETPPRVVTGSVEYRTCLASGATTLRKVIKRN